MAVKDYYKILQIEPGSDRAAIKKAFRKLAMSYHPDKQGQHQHYDSYFREIQEAYETLYDPHKREAYHYQRWLQGAMGHTLDTALSAEQILQLFIKAERYLSTADQFRTDKKILAFQLLELYSPSRLETIQHHSDDSIRKEVIRTAISAASRLDSPGSQQLMERCSALLAKESELASRWMHVQADIEQREKNAKMKIPLLILITIVLCLLFWLSRQ